MKLLSVLLLSVFFISGVASAQKFTLGKVSEDELKQKRHPRDTSAVAAVLFNKGRSYMDYDGRRGWTLIHEFSIRIKIYKTEGLQYANYRIPYYIGYDDLAQEYIKIDDAVTYNLRGGKIEKTKLQGEGKLSEKVNDKWKTLTITMPDVHVGSVIEFAYKHHSENLFEFPDFTFQREIPVDHVSYRTELPVVYVYKPVLRGYADIKVEHKVESATDDYTNHVNQRTEVLSYNQLSSSYTGVALPALKQEAYVDNIRNYASSISHELESMRHAEGGDKNFSKSWENVVKEIEKRPDFGMQMKEAGFFETETGFAIADATSQQERMQQVYKLVKRKVKWNGNLSMSTDQGVRKAYANGTGNSAEVNLILCMMLRHAGVDANPVLCSSISNGIPAFPGVTAFNNVVVAADVNGKRWLLDATHQNAVPGILPLHDLNWKGRLVNRFGGSEEVNMHTTLISREAVSVSASLTPEGSVAGKINYRKSDYRALKHLDMYRDQDRNQYLESLENALDGIVISDYNFEESNTENLQVTETFAFSSSHHSEIIGDKLYVDPFLFFGFEQNPFLSEDRKLPVYFGYPTQSNYVATFALPEGYEVESLPQAVALGTEGNVATFRASLSQVGRNIQVVAKVELNQTLVSSEFYPTLREFYKKMTDKFKERIVLKKI